MKIDELLLSEGQEGRRQIQKLEEQERHLVQQFRQQMEQRDQQIERLPEVQQIDQQIQKLTDASDEAARQRLGIANWIDLNGALVYRYTGELLGTMGTSGKYNGKFIVTPNQDPTGMVRHYIGIWYILSIC